MNVFEVEKLIMLYFEEVWNLGKLDILEDIIDPEYVNHSPGTPNPPRGPVGLRPIIAAMRKAIPDLNYEVLDWVYGDNKVAIRSRMTGTHREELFGIPPTGKKIDVMQFQIEHLRNGKIVAHWRQTDDLTMMKQLGLVPA
ncbi:MAG TPA: ester cyclase [Calditrichia bacterium]|nr:ester cyclase [Calditrichia bacterium]HQV33143.1 ester cyclase [Calditrichia bacterium]